MGIFDRSQTTRSSSRWKAISVAIVFAPILAVSPLIGNYVGASDVTACPQGASLNIVAHADDDLIFMNPDIQRDIDNGVCVRTIVATAGDAGLGFDYAEDREEGSRAAYAEMAGVANEWTVEENFVVNGHTLWLFTLDQKPNISLVYMRINDGNINGDGFGSTGYASLEKLWDGPNTTTISSIDSIDEYKNTYTKQDLITTLADFIMLYAPETIRSMDFLTATNDASDHSDHVALGRFTQRAERESVNVNQLIAYRGYVITGLSANVSGAALNAKWDAFMAYATHDYQLCGNPDSCARLGAPYNAWIERQYKRGTRNIASLATVTASSQNTAGGQGAVKAVDGQALGYPVDSTKEWATVGGRENSWINLTWKSQQKIDKVVLYDRPNTNDRITGGTLTFSDGSTVAVSGLYNKGTAKVIVFPAKTTMSLKFTVKTVSASTGNVGLSEIEAITTNIAGEATVTASSQNTAGGQGAVKAIDGQAIGYPTDSTKEWATVGGKTNSWIKLSWVSQRYATKITLFDRPNTSDQVLGGDLIFSDGRVVKVGNLPNDGTPREVVLPGVYATNSVQFKVTSVSPTTGNVGLAEIQVHD